MTTTTKCLSDFKIIYKAYRDRKTKQENTKFLTRYNQLTAWKNEQKLELKNYKKMISKNKKTPVREATAIPDIEELDRTCLEGTMSNKANARRDALLALELAKKQEKERNKPIKKLTSSDSAIARELAMIKKTNEGEDVESVKLINVKELAYDYGCSERTVYRLARKLKEERNKPIKKLTSSDSAIARELAMIKKTNEGEDVESVKLINVKELAYDYGCSERTVYRLARKLKEEEKVEPQLFRGKIAYTQSQFNEFFVPVLDEIFKKTTKQTS